MTDYKERRCHDCADGTVRLVRKAGRRTRYKHVELEVPAEAAIPTCDRCGAEWWNDATAKAIDDSMEPIYLQELAKRS